MNRLNGEQTIDTGLAPAEEGGQGRGLLQVLWARKSLVILGVVVGAICAVIYYSRATPIYESQAMVLIVRKGSSPLRSGSGDANTAVVQDYTTTHLQVIRSRVVIQRAVEDGKLAKLPMLQGVDPVGYIYSQLRAKPDESSSGNTPSNIIILTIRGTHPADCATILSAVIASYQKQLELTFQNLSTEKLGQITSVRANLNNDYNKYLTQYNQVDAKGPRLKFNSKGELVAETDFDVAQSENQKLLGQVALYNAQIEMAETAIKGGKKRAEIMALLGLKYKEDSYLSQRRLALRELRSLEAIKLTSYGPGAKEVKQIRTRIRVIEEELAERENRRRKLLGTDDTEALSDDPIAQFLWEVKTRRGVAVAQLDANKKRLTQMLDDLEAKKAKARELKKIEKQIARTEMILTKVEATLDQLNLVQGAAVMETLVLSEAQPGGKVAPSLMKTMFFGCLMGLALGVGLAYLAEAADKSFRTPDEIRRRLDLPVIGHVPIVEPDAQAAAAIQAGEKVPDPWLIAHYRPRTVEAESFRALRTSLYFSTLGAGHSVVQVTSPDMGDGKSTVATNLAVSIAQSGKKIIIVDADLRRPRLHKIFGLSNEGGLSSIIAGGAATEDVIQHRDEFPSLSFLTAGPPPENPAELLTQPRFQEVIEELRTQYEFVLVDTPPVLVVTDPCVVAPRVDGLILTIRLSKKCGPRAVQAKEILSTLGVSVLGVVVNGLNPNAGRAGFGSYDYSYGPSNYAYESDDDGEESYYGGYHDEPSGNGKPAPTPGV